MTAGKLIDNLIATDTEVQNMNSTQTFVVTVIEGYCDLGDEILPVDILEEVIAACENNDSMDGMDIIKTASVLCEAILRKEK